MSVDSTTYQAGPYPTNGVTVLFSGGSSFFIAPPVDSTNLVDVWLRNQTTGVLVLLSEAPSGTDTYTVDRNDDGTFDITTADTYATGSEIIILRGQIFKQEKVFTLNGAFYAPTHEAGFDYDTYGLQEHDEKLTRALLVPIGSGIDPDDLVEALISITGTGPTTFADDVFFLLGSSDPTKAIRFEVDTNVPTGTTVVLTAPASDVTIIGRDTVDTLTNKTVDADDNTFSNFRHGDEVDDPSSGVHGVTGDIVGIDDSQTLSNKTLDNTNSITVKTDGLVIQDAAAITKQADWDLSGITAGQTRTLFMPDSDVYLGVAGGEDNTSSNSGGFAELALPKVTVDLPFRTIQSSDSTLTVTQNASDIDITITEDTTFRQAKYYGQVRPYFGVHKYVPLPPTAAPAGIVSIDANTLEFSIPSDIVTIVIWNTAGVWTYGGPGAGSTSTFATNAPYCKNVPAGTVAFGSGPTWETFQRIVCFKHAGDGVWYTQSVTNKGSIASPGGLPTYVLQPYDVPITSDTFTGWYQRQVDSFMDFSVYFNDAKTAIRYTCPVGDQQGVLEMYDYLLPEIK